MPKLKKKLTGYYISPSYLNCLEDAEAPNTVWIKILKAPVEIEAGIKRFNGNYKRITIEEL